MKLYQSTSSSETPHLLIDLEAAVYLGALLVPLSHHSTIAGSSQRSAAVYTSTASECSLVAVLTLGPTLSSLIYRQHEIVQSLVIETRLVIPVKNSHILGADVSFVDLARKGLGNSAKRQDDHGGEP
jgi:hypothetical protein